MTPSEKNLEAITREYQALFERRLGPTAGVLWAKNDELLREVNRLTAELAHERRGRKHNGWIAFLLWALLMLALWRWR